MTESESPSPRHTPEGDNYRVPYERTVDRVVEKIQDESLLFIIAVILLFVGLAVLAGDSPNLHFIAAIIALMGVIGVVVHFIQGEVKYRRDLNDRRLNSDKNRSSREKHKAVIESKKAQRFWKSFVQDELQVVTGHFQKKDSDLEEKVWEPAGLIGAGDAMAIAELSAFFGGMNLSDFETTYAGRGFKMDEKGVKHQNLILLGASDYNVVTEMAMERIKSTLSFGKSIKGQQIAIYNGKTKEEPLDYSVESRSDSLVKVQVTDYSLIIKTKNPFQEENQEEKQLLLVAGCSGYGTWAGIQFVISLRFLENPLVTSGKPCEFLIETKVMDGQLMPTSVCGSAALGETLEPVEYG